MNKRMKHFWWEYCNSNATELSQVYKTCSKDKKDAYMSCKRAMIALDGEDFRILSANTYSFTVGFKYPHPETGVLMFKVYTSRNHYECEL